MDNDKKLWLCEQYAQKAWTLSLVLLQEAARAGEHGRGYAVVAREARTLADKLFEYVASVRFDRGGNDFKGIADFAIMLKFLATNAAIENMRVAQAHMDFNIPKSMAVFADEMRRLAGNINELAEKSIWDKPFTIPEMANPVSSNNMEYFFKYSICGYAFIESMNSIVEVCYPRRIDIEGKTFFLRGLKLPIIDCYKCFDLPYSGYDSEHQTVMIVCLDGDKYAVPIDDLDIDAIFYSRSGTPVQPQQDHTFAEYARECWDAVGGDQLIFIDWSKMILKK